VLLWPVALGLSIAGSAAGLLVASVLLFIHHPLRVRAVPWLVSYAVGTLLGAALLALLPEALRDLAPRPAMAALLAGVLTFFIVEKLVLCRHCDHEDECDMHQSTATLVIVGDAIHTFVDGAVIAASVLVSLPLGVTTALAVVAHEIPHQSGDYAVLLATGLGRAQALILGAATAAGGLLGAAAMLLFGSRVPFGVPFVIAFAAGNFLYVAMAHLIPTLHRGQLDRNSFRQVALISLGIATIVAL
jgi:zinc and cadmium transporter